MAIFPSRVSCTKMKKKKHLGGYPLGTHMAIVANRDQKGLSLVAMASLGQATLYEHRG